MSILISCQNISKAFGAWPLFEGLSLGLFEGERTGLIGPNGSGKSTLLKILAGVETPDAGVLALRRGLRVGCVAQQDAFGDDAPTAGAALAGALAGLDLTPHELEERVATGLIQAGVRAERPVVSLSGGERKRLAILGQALRRPDLLLLDEPTNHLDVEGVLWLEALLSGLETSFVVVTHDRRFLERVTNRVIELNRRYAEGHFSSAGNYSDFLESREKHLSARAAQEESLRNIVRREVEWLRRGPKARTTKQKARVDRAGALMAELADLSARNAEDRTARIAFTDGARRTRKLVEARGVAKGLGGRKLFGPLDFTLGPGDRLGLLGGNGSGKSTFLKMLAGGLAPDAGTLERAEGLKVTVFDQHREQLDLSLPLRKALCPEGEHVHFRGAAIHVRGWAERFLFRREQFDAPLSRLSGGEQARVLLARLMLKPADLLLLDEPTNDLDIGTLQVLEESLLDFPGALVLVTHDRYLLDRVSQGLLALDGRGNGRFFADLDQWESRRAEERTPGAEAPATVAPAAQQKLSPHSREARKAEAAVHAAERAAAAARAALEDPAVATDAQELARRQAAWEAAQRKADELFQAWAELTG